MIDEAITDAILRHSLQILRLSAGQEKQVDAVMREMGQELELLLKYGDLDAPSKRDVAKLLAEAKAAIDTGYLRANAATDTHALAVIVAEHTQATLESIIPAAANIPTDAVLKALAKDVLIDGAPSSAWWARQAADTAFRFAAQVRQGVVNGETQEQIVARISGRRGEPGIMDISRRNARALVHSSVMTAANAARLATFRKNSRFVGGVKWLATLDMNTCKTCGVLDGQSWNLDGEKLKGTKQPFTAPPRHFGCRCVLTGIPRTDAIDEAFPGLGDKLLGTFERASSQGPVDGRTTFEQFLSRQSPEFIKATLGKTRAEAYTAGKITLRDLVSGTGRPLTLDELRLH